MRWLAWLPLLAVGLGASAAPRQPWQAVPVGVMAALKAHHILVPGWKFFRATYVCSVTAGTDHLPVIDVLQQEPEAMEPRLIDQAVVLNAGLAPVQRFRLTGVTPLFCQGADLYFSGDVRAEDGSEGNRVTFMLGGAYIKFNDVDPSEFPAPVN